jgi:hypothetical protein
MDPARCPLPPGVEISLTNDHRQWRGGLRDGPLTVEARGDAPEAVVGQRLRLDAENGKDPLVT